MTSHLSCQPFRILGKLRCIISTCLTFEFAFCLKVMKHGRRNALWLKGTSPFPFPYRHKYLNYTHLRSRCGSLNFLPSGPASFRLCLLVFEMQNKFLWRRLCGLLVGGSQAVRPEGSRVFGHCSDPGFIFHCCTHFIKFRLGCRG